MNSSKIEFVSDSSILISFADEASPDASTQVLNLFYKLSKLKNYSITNLHPAYCSLLVDLDLRSGSREKIFEFLSQQLLAVEENENPISAVIEIPVNYDGEDLPEVSQITGISRQEVIQRHSEAEYRVAFLGFAPGFPYLLGLPKSLACPRKKNPRLKVPAGSVAIAGEQTGIYPTDSPGGWQLIGRTCVSLFDLKKSSPSLLQPGDRVRFTVSSKSVVMQIDQSAPAAEKKEAVLKIENPGFFSLIQDQGRFGWAHLGVSPGGAADSLALRLGNQLVGNNETAAAIEMTSTGANFIFLKDTWIAVTGADGIPTLDGLPIAMWTSLPVCAGQRLAVNSMPFHLRSYLCIYGGIGTEPVLGSRSTFVSGKWGGPLQAGDHLPAGRQASESPRFRKVKNPVLDFYNKKEKIFRVTLGPQQEWFSGESLKLFFENEFEVTNDVNRLGIRLAGAKLEYHEKFRGRELVSEGIANGAIQVAQGGQAFILFCEQQTTGGYPKLANVIKADLYKLGQLKPGDRVRFVQTSLAEAWKIQDDEERILKTAVYDF
ncbi:MAG: 5-oxoprolinase subunit PxpB [Pseudobdellovibrio sp.]